MLAGFFGGGGGGGFLDIEAVSSDTGGLRGGLDTCCWGNVAPGCG